MKMQIWDVSGQERFRSIVNLYYRDADGALIVFDTTDKQSFENVKQWLQELEDKAPKNIEIILVGNKIDLSD
jgi:Ras-related protein Rab-1A